MHRLLPVVALASITCAALASPPRANVPPNIEVRAFVPHAGYHRTVQVLRAQRMNAANDAAAPRNQTFALTGNRGLPVILLEFNNVNAPFPADAYQTLLFGERTGLESPLPLTMTQYYKDASHGRLKVSGRTLGWYKLPKTDTYYEHGENGGGDPFGEMLQFGLTSADAQIDFGQFDNDGPDGQPNSGDDDGKVDTVFFIHPEVGAECGGSAANNIWSHSWHYKFAHASGAPFVTGDIRLDADGNPVLTPTGENARIIVDDYTIQPALSCSSGGPGEHSIIEIGVFCHEYGHALGLPDLYDRTPNPSSAGVGNWCLMASGSYGADGMHADCPAHMSAWCKQHLGWAAPERVSLSASLWLEPAEDRGRIYRIDVPGTGHKEYFLVEYRHKGWADLVYAMRHNWDQHCFASGLAIWHIDERVGEASPTWPFTNHNEGQNDWPSLPNATKHALVALEQPDGQQHLERNSGRGDSGDVFVAGSRFENDPNGLVGSQGYGGATQIVVRDIYLNGDSGQIIVELPQGSDPIAVADATPPAGGPARPAPATAAAPPVGRRGDTLTDARSRIREFGSPTRSAKDQSDDMAVMKAAVAGSDKVTPELAEAIKRMPEQEIEARFGPQGTPLVRRVAADARTKMLSQNSSTDSAAEQKLVDYIKAKKAKSFVEVQLDPTQMRAERVVGLAIKQQRPTPAEDAQQLIAGDLKPIMGPDVKWKSVPAKANVPAPETFEQVVDVQGQSLPVFGTAARLYYNPTNKELTAIQSKCVSPDQLVVTGQVGEMTGETAVRIARQQLALPEGAKLVGEARSGVYQVKKDPKRGRVAFEMTFEAGAEQAPMKVYLDAETKEILQIE